MPSYSLHGLNISSSIDLSPLPASAQVANIHITEAEIPPSLDSATVTRATYAINETTTLISIPGLGRFLVQDQNQILVCRDNGISDLDLLPIIVGPVWAALLHQRGLFPLAGSLVEYKGNGILLCGHSAAGVSTMALALARQGMQPLSDEFCLINTSADTVMAQPGIPALKLWQDVMHVLDIDPSPLQRVRTAMEKYWYPLPSSQAIPLKAIIQLRDLRTDTEPTGLTEKKGFSAFTAIDQLTLHLAYLRPLSVQQQQFSRCTRLAKHTVVLRYQYPHILASLADESQKLQRAIEAWL